MSHHYHAIPTHIFTGFLGVGKTSLIKRFLAEKPTGERWAVLVNEFGEVGIDGALLATDDIAVSEVPGGCMCCSVGVPSRAALNNLIKRQNPDRIIIEPTGLANPRQILDVFSGPEYASVLDIKAVVCLVDPWCFSEPTFLQLPDFHQQLHVADIVAATKLDLATPEQVQQFYTYCQQRLPADTVVTALSEKLPWGWFTQPRVTSLGEVPEQQLGHHSAGHHGHAEKDHESGGAGLVLGEDGSFRKENQAEFGYSCGWVFDSNWVFAKEKLEHFLLGLAVPRVKGVLLTEQGWFSFNRMRDTLSCAPYETGLTASRLEMITLDPVDWAVLDRDLRGCAA